MSRRFYFIHCENRYLEDSQSKFHEVFFKSCYVTHFPWKSNNEHIPLLNGFKTVPLQSQTFKVIRLCRFTHNAQANEIDNGDHYIFKPSRLFGLGGTDSNYESFIASNSSVIPSRMSVYNHILKTKEIIPGFYVWWLVDLSKLFPKNQFLTKKTEGFSATYYASEPFKTDSNHGNVKFEISLANMIKCYQKSFNGPLRSIQLRCGGTLRYKHKINYIVIVCLENDSHQSQLHAFPVLHHDIKYKENGEIAYIELPVLKLKNGISKTCIRNLSTNETTTQSFSWDTSTFLLYFPNEEYQLICPKDMASTNNVEHENCNCMEFDIDGILKCPNELQPIPQFVQQPVPQSKSKPVQQSRSKPVPQSKSKPVQQSKSKPVQQSKSKPVPQPKSQPVQQPKSQRVQEPKSQPVQQPKSQPVQELKSQPVPQLKSQPVQQLKSQPVQEPKSQPVPQPKSQPVPQHLFKHKCKQKRKVTQSVTTLSLKKEFLNRNHRPWKKQYFTKKRRKHHLHNSQYKDDDDVIWFLGHILQKNKLRSVGTGAILQTKKQIMKEKKMQWMTKNVF